HTKAGDGRPGDPGAARVPHAGSQGEGKGERRELPEQVLHDSGDVRGHAPADTNEGSEPGSGAGDAKSAPDASGRQEQDKE
ncbi:MAG: hypothetical protein CMO44_17370, partial [Verrucomicrobiales bacterium]|nr:hypothetical protein [Verrucomicrobiales bacterium]